MDFFHLERGELWCEGVPLEEVAARVGTPCYVYSYATLRRHYEVFEAALARLPHLTCYSVKANTSGAILAALAALGSGADIVSGGELHRALRAGIPAERIVFSGVGKRPDEISAALDAKILLLNVESEAELEAIAAVARARGQRAPISLRVNPDVDPRTHPYIATGLRDNKFGIAMEHAAAVFARAVAMPELVVRGVDCHIGSQLTKVEPFIDSVQRMVKLARDVRALGADLHYLDIGGGLGIRYSEETPPSPEEYGRAVGEVVAQLGTTDWDMTLVTEPGRVIVGNAGLLLTRVLYVKTNGAKKFVIVDAAMNDLIRPTLYGSFHAIRLVRPTGRAEETVDIVGPVCESGDFLARDRLLPQVEAGELVAVMSAGAYGYSMASNYNSRPRAAEAMVRGAELAVVRDREMLDDLTRGERVPEWVRGDR
jgi:diaminopimelate decarboxylase